MKPIIHQSHGRRPSTSASSGDSSSRDRSSAPSTMSSRLTTPADSTSSYPSTAPSYASTFSSRQIATPSTPSQFAELFPSTEKLTITHDSGPDAALNLRVDSPHPDGPLTLFYARLYDLYDREISVRRYGRDCGREVAKIKRKFETRKERPGVQRSVSKGLQALLTRQSSEPGVLSRRSSGVWSDYAPSDVDSSDESYTEEKATNTCILEFSNYAHVDITRRGQRGNKKYEFEYWGRQYTWRRHIRNEGAWDEAVEFALYWPGSSRPIAELKPTPISPDALADHYTRGLFIPPCTLQLLTADREKTDIADVIVTTALLTLVDDNLKRRQQKKRYLQIQMPVVGKMNMEYVGPKRILDEMVKRRPSVGLRSLSAQVSRAATPKSGLSRAGTPVPKRMPTH